MAECGWSHCSDEAEVVVSGREGTEHFTLELCRRHWQALEEQRGPWHLERR